MGSTDPKTLEEARRALGLAGRDHDEESATTPSNPPILRGTPRAVRRVCFRSSGCWYVAAAVTWGVAGQCRGVRACIQLRSTGAPAEVFDPDHRGAKVEAGEVALGGLVVPGGDPSPGLQPVDRAFDGVPFLVQIGVVADGPAARAALPLPVGGLVPLLRDDRLDTAFAQVGAVAAGRAG